MTHLTTRFARWHTDHAQGANQHPLQQKRTRKIAFTLGGLLILLLAVVTVWLYLVLRNPQPGIGSPDATPRMVPSNKSSEPPWSTAGTGTLRDRLPRFRFPDERYKPVARRPDWHLLGSNQPGEDGYPMILGSLKHRMLHFTFDDGPSLDTTARILNALSDYNLRATFFVLGKHLFGPDAKAHRELLRRLDQDGHTVALHSYSHNDLRSLSDSQIHRELYRSERMMEATLGYRPGLFRPPYGGRSERTNSLLQTRGYTEVLWNIAPEEYGARSPWEIVSNFHSALNQQEQNDYGPGGIVLLHDSRATTADAFPLLMEELRRRNCVLVNQEGEELWDVVGDLSYFLFYSNGLPENLVAQRQALAREAATGYCAETSAEEPPTRVEQSIPLEAG